ncbi:aminoglycoside phosphotransferase family protein [Stenotrophomonas sp. 278]|uniref:phosphotransferase enzyme family protein n=1 Tax=Stenotrophomonas sp. 278 TaxID=2479851 RepID=UPI000F68071E|nr:aminoglycoside phosphotransferase family protein [Stenotrophomonas sp. 278]RRU17168.1 aminoglycoside phosphotransferase family protein [Stenotrophomonas sp. 278]
MRHPQELSVAQITAVLAQAYDVHAEQVVQRPAGADAGATVYQVVARDGARWWLKCRRYAVGDAVWKVLQYLRTELQLSEVAAPLTTRNGAPAVLADGLQWTLFPYIEGQSGFEAALSREQWHRLGQVLRSVHEASVPAALLAPLAQPQLEDEPAVERVGAWLQGGDAQWQISDELAERYRQTWRLYRPLIADVWQRCVQLRARLAGQTAAVVLCHGDVHAGNVLLRPDGGLCLIDWDGMLRAPRECDLMFIGAGVGGRWGRDDPPGFAEGYGPVTLDPVRLACYRHWRILHDIQEFHDLLLEPGAAARPPSQRLQALRYMQDQFAPNNVVDAAARSWAAAGAAP